MKLIRPETSRAGSYDWLQDFFNDDSFLRSSFPWSLRTEGPGVFLSGVRTDIYEDAENYHAVMEMPGVSKGDLKVEVENSVLTVGGKRQTFREGGEGHEEFSRSISIPDSVDNARIEAELRDGLLLVKMPKDDSNKVRTISVN